MPKARTPKNGKSAATAVAAVPVSTRAEMDLEAEIRLRAYELYEQRGRMPGHEAEDWFVAEREVVTRHA